MSLRSETKNKENYFLLGSNAKDAHVYSEPAVRAVHSVGGQVYISSPVISILCHIYGATQALSQLVFHSERIGSCKSHLENGKGPLKN